MLPKDLTMRHDGLDLARTEVLDTAKGIDWSWLAMDGATTKAPLGGTKKAITVAFVCKSYI